MRDALGRDAGAARRGGDFSAGRTGEAFTAPLRYRLRAAGPDKPEPATLLVTPGFARRPSSTPPPLRPGLTPTRRCDTVSARPVLTSESRPPVLSPPAWPGVTLRRGPRSRPASSSAPVSATLRAHGKAWSHERWALWIARRPAAGPHLLAAVSADGPP